MRLYKGRKTGDGKQETENTDGKTEGAKRRRTFWDCTKGGTLETENWRRKTQTENRRRVAQNKILRLHKWRKTGDGKQETEHMRRKELARMPLASPGGALDE